MDTQLESCFREIDRMRYSEVVEEDLIKLKSQMAHSYKFGSSAQHIYKTLDTVIKLLKNINNKIIELDLQLSEIDIKLNHYKLTN